MQSWQIYLRIRPCRTAKEAVLLLVWRLLRSHFYKFRPWWIEWTQFRAFGDANVEKAISRSAFGRLMRSRESSRHVYPTDLRTCIEHIPQHHYRTEANRAMECKSSLASFEFSTFVGFVRLCVLDDMRVGVEVHGMAAWDKLHRESDRKWTSWGEVEFEGPNASTPSRETTRVHPIDSLL